MICRFLLRQITAILIGAQRGQTKHVETGARGAGATAAERGSESLPAAASAPHNVYAIKHLHMAVVLLSDFEGN